MPSLMLHRRLFWDRFTDGGGSWRERGGPPGEELAALRRGAGREPGSVAALWEHHAVSVDDRWLLQHRTSWSVPSDYAAEHHALTLFGFHQQSVWDIPMHRKGMGVGTAALKLRQTDDNIGDAVDRRFATTATTTTVEELVVHLRSLVVMLRGKRIPLDYRQLLDDLIGWQHPDGPARVRRRWGLQYYASSSQDRQDTNGDR